MKYSKISELFFDDGCLIDGQGTDLHTLENEIVIKNFENYGVIIFRNFDHAVSNLIDFTNKFTKTYANDALRRKIRLENNKIRDVDIGLQKVDLHSEASFSPAWPEIIWFSCLSASNLKNSGRTLLCDGIKLWENINSQTKKFFLSNQIKYDLKIPYAEPQIGKNTKEWYIDEPGVQNCKLNPEKGLIEFEFKRYAVGKSRIQNKLAFANHLIVSLDSENQLFSRTLENGKEIPIQIRNEILEKSLSLSFKFEWEVGDIMMIDNKRFMHGRESIKENDTRDIINVQSLKSSFGFGHYTIK